MIESEQKDVFIKMDVQNYRPDVSIIYHGQLTKGELGICNEQKFNGWLMWRHPDGQWVSLCDLKNIKIKDWRL